MNIANECIDKITLTLEEPKRVLKTLYIGPVNNPTENTFFNSDLSKIIDDTSIIIEEDKCIELINGKKMKCFLYEIQNESDSGLEAKDININDNERLFFFFNIYCSENKKTLIRFGKGSRFKVWINEQICFNGYGVPNETDFIIIQLNKGNNIVIAEFSPTKHLHGTAFSCRVSELNNENSLIETEATRNYCNLFGVNKIQLICNNFCLINENIHQFSVIPRDYINIDRNSPIKVVVKNFHEDIIDEFYTQIGKNINYDTSNFMKEHKNEFLLTFQVIYENKDKHVLNMSHTIICGDIFNFILNDINKFYIFLEKTHLIRDQSINLQGMIKDYEEILARLKFAIEHNNVRLQKDSINQMLTLKQRLTKIVMSNEYYNIIDAYLIERGKSFDVYYKSKLDDSIQKYIIYTPANYERNKKYPLLINIATSDFTLNSYTHQEFSSQIPSNVPGDIICAIIFIRNVTLGSYIGEASFFESLDNIFETYSIDKDRIYLTGYSNGAFACWALAQNHPGSFAAIAPISGNLYLNNIKNINLIPSFSVFADKDHDVLVQTGRILQKLKLDNQSNKSKVLFAKEMDHGGLGAIYTLNSYIIKWLIKHKREEYPKKIYFRTEKIRYNKVYWITILDIDEYANYCEIEGTLISNNEIVIKLCNVKRFVLTVPDFMNAGSLDVIINGIAINIKRNIKLNELYFKKVNDVYYLSNDVDKNICRYSSKGMGILDIFMDGVNIVIPATFNNNEEKKAINRVAAALSMPKTRTYDPDINIHYPIITDEQLNETIVNNSNLAIIDTNNNNDFLKKIKCNLSIQIRNNGYEYKGKYYEEDYCILFIEPNPLNKEKKVLIIYTNRYSLFRENFFTRKFIIPSNANGKHPYLNCEAIIYNGKQYTVIDMLGNDILSLTESV